MGGKGCTARRLAGREEHRDSVGASFRASDEPDYRELGARSAVFLIHTEGSGWAHAKKQALLRALLKNRMLSQWECERRVMDDREQGNEEARRYGAEDRSRAIFLKELSRSALRIHLHDCNDRRPSNHKIRDTQAIL